MVYTLYRNQDVLEKECPAIRQPASTVLALVTKISKLNRLPQLLNKKREADLEERKNRDEMSDRPPFPFNHRINKKKDGYKAGTSYETGREIQTIRARKAGIGRRLDVFA